MSDIRLAAQLMRDGFTASKLSRLVRHRELVRVRRGAYRSPETLDLRGTHLALLAATLPGLAPDSVVSHGSAAALHDLPLFGQNLDRVQITRPEIEGGRLRGAVNLHAAPIPATDWTEIAGYRVTTLARTIADLARCGSFESAVVAGDAAVRAGLSADSLDACLRGMRRWPGVVQGRRVAAFLDGRAESPGESRSRVRVHAAGLPRPDLQLEIADETTRTIARSDFGWREWSTIGEFDGRIKYGRLLRDGESIEDVVYREKLREDALRSMGWQVVRWTWADLDDFSGVVRRLHAAFERGRHFPLLPVPRL